MPVTENSPCGACTQSCCFDYTVYVTGYEAWLIASSLKVAMEQFLVCYPVSTEDPDSFKLDGGTVRFKIALAKVKPRDHEERLPCTFWMPLPEGYGRCGIYAVRPLVCQTYPAFLKGGTVHLRTDSLCPARGWQLSSMNLPAWLSRLVRSRLEYDIYSSLIRRWNTFVEAANPRSRVPINLFFGCLMNTYDRLDVFRRSLDERRLDELASTWSGFSDRQVNPLEVAGMPEEADSEGELSAFLSEVRSILAGSIPASCPHSLLAGPMEIRQ